MWSFIQNMNDVGHCIVLTRGGGSPGVHILKTLRSIGCPWSVVKTFKLEHLKCECRARGLFKLLTESEVYRMFLMR